MLSVIQRPVIVAVSDMMKVVIEDTDYKVSNATPASVSIIISNATQLLGDYIIISGQRFDVTNTNSGNTVNFLTSTTTLQAAQNLENAVLLNWYLGQNVTTVINSILGAHELVITWSTAGLIENFTFSQALDNPFTITPVNGANNQYKKGGNVLMSVYEVGTPDKLININPIKAKPNASEQATFFLKDIVKNRMDSGLPAFSCNDQPYKITGHKKDFYFKYTSVENLETCGVKYGEVNGSDNLTVYNVVLDDSSEYFLVPYLFQNIAQIGVKFVKWLTYRGNISKISCNTCGYANIIHSFNNTAQIKYETFENNVSTGIFTHPTLISGAGTWAIPLNLNQSFIGANSDKISIWISNGITDLSEKLTLAIDRECCDDNNELYFLNDLGVYEVLHFDSIQSVDIETIAEETCAMINQSDSYNLRMQTNGKSFINIESTETYTIVTSENQRTKWYLDMIKQLSKSPSIFMRYGTDTGTFKRKVSILPNSFTVYSKDERLFNEFRIRFHNDVKIANY